MKNLIQKVSLLLIGLCSAILVNAQVVTGVVKDSAGEPLIGVGIRVQGTTTGTMTDIDGKYSINVKGGKILEFSTIGLKTEVISVDGRSVIDVVLTEDANFLEETVVIGYATVKRRDLMGSVTSVDSKTLTAAPVANVAEALTGKMAGVQVTATEGDPDADVKIRVRGAGSITQDSSPLYIVDGFPVDNINDIPASDIQSIDVLKDAFSTAIYGSRGANGVVLVTTKSAQHDKITVSYNMYAGAKQMANRNAIQVMSPYDFVRTQYEVNAITGKLNDYYEPYFGAFQDLDLYKNVKGNDWIKQLFGRTGSSMNHNFSVAGSGENYKWNLSYANNSDKAIMIGSDYVRNNLAFKAQFKPFKALTIDVNTRYSNTVVNGSGANSINESGSTSGSAARLKHAVQYSPIPLASIADSDQEEDYGDAAPPLQSVKDNDKRRTRQSWNINGAVTWQIIKNLNLKVEGGLEDYNQGDNQFYGLTTYYVANTAECEKNPAAMYSYISRQRYRNTNTLSYNFDKVITDNRHHLDLLAGFEYMITKSYKENAIACNFPSFFTSQDAWNFMSTAQTVKEYNNFYNPDEKLMSYFGRANYEFDHKYSLSLTFRADGSSKFAKGKQWGFFPSAAAAWTISNEDFMKDIREIDNLKLRYSFGTAGNNNIPSGVSAMYFSGTSASEAGWVYGTSTPWAPTTVGGHTVMANPDLTWETTYSHNLGVDFSFLRRRISGSIEAYYSTVHNLLIQFPTSGSGYEFQYKNIGSLSNTGAEISLSGVVLENKNYGLTISGNISFNRNRVTDLGGLSEITSNSGWASTEFVYDYVVREGLPLGNIVGYEMDGRYTASDFTYDAANNKWILNEGVVNCSDVYGAQFLRPGAPKVKADENGNPELKVLGNIQPVAVGGFNINANYYGFDFVANFNYVLGNKIYNANKIEFSHTRKYYGSYRRNLLESMSPDKRWTNIDWNTGEVVTDAAILDEMNAGTTMWSPYVYKAFVSDWAIEDGSFLRLSSLTLGYTIPEKYTEKFHCKKLRVYATGSNLFCLTKYSGYDPEVDCRRATPLTPGVDFSAYPKSIGFVAGLNITF